MKFMLELRLGCWADYIVVRWSLIWITISSCRFYSPKCRSLFVMLTLFWSFRQMSIVI